MQIAEKEAILEAFIAVERRAASLYRHFLHRFPQDRALWWTLVMEEENHAALLRAQKDIFLKPGYVPSGLFAAAEDDLRTTATAIDALIAAQGEAPFTRMSALQTALAIETMAGELHFQRLIEAHPDTPTLRVFQELIGSERDHARRIEAYIERLANPTTH